MFGITLRNLRNSKNLSQEELAEIIGVSKSTIGMYEQGKRIPKADATLKKLAEFFSVSIDYLMGLSPNKEDVTPSNIYSVEGLVSFEEIGTVKAGFDGMAAEIPTGRTIEIPASMLGGRSQEDFFMLRVNGDSMYPTLHDGDSILCLRCSSVDPGTLAVVLYNGDEASVKKVNYIYGQNWMELIPDNPEYKTKRIEGADLEQCRVLGKVVKLIRDCAPAKSFTVIKPQNKNQNKILSLLDSLSEDEQRSLIQELKNKKKASLSDFGEIAAEGGELNRPPKKNKKETTL